MRSRAPRARRSAWIPEAAPEALAELLGDVCPDVVLDSALCGDELVRALLCVTSVCDLADLRTDPWRVAIALGSDAEGVLDGLDGVDVIGRGADARQARGLALGGCQGACLDRRRGARHPGRTTALRRHERFVPPPALAPSAALGDALDLIACGHELVRALQGSAARLRRTD